MTAPVTTCYRHSDRRAGVSCQRCSRPICTNCMVQASVGFQCPECAKGGQQKVYNSRNIHTLNRPYVTYALIAINVIVFAVDALLTQANANKACFGLRGSDLPTELQHYGGLSLEIPYCNGNIGGLAHGEWWRLITSGFVHFGFIHLALNMVALYIVGIQLEKGLGRGKYLALYLTSLLAGSLVVVLFSGNALSAGASGAIFGLFGVAFVYQRSLGIDPFKSGLAGIILINLVFTFTFSGISWQAHVGGLVGGAAAAFATFWLEKQVKSPAVAYLFLGAISLCLFFGAVIAAGTTATRF